MSTNDNELEGIQLLTPTETNAIFSNETPGEETPTEEATSEEIENTEETLSLIEPEVLAKAETSTEGLSTEEESASSNTEPETEAEKPAALNKYGAFIKEMVSEGILTVEEEAQLDELLEGADYNTLKQVMESTLDGKFKTKQEDWKKGLSPEKRKFLEIEGTFDKAGEAIQMAQRLSFFENLDSATLQEDTNLQKNVYFDLLKSKGFTDEEAREEVVDAEQLGKLFEKSNRAIPQLKAHASNIVDEAEKEKQKQFTDLEESNKQRFDALMKSVDDKEDIVSGIKLSKIAKDKLKKNITETVYQDKTGKSYTSLMYKQNKNPAGFEMLVNYFDTIGLFNIDKDGKFKPDISKLKNIAKTKATTELDVVLAGENEKGRGRNSSTASDKTMGILDMLEAASKK